MLPLYDQACAHGLQPSRDPSTFVLLTRGDYLPVPFGDIHRFRHRHPVVATKVSSFSFDAALLVRLGRRAELRFEPPV